MDASTEASIIVGALIAALAIAAVLARFYTRISRKADLRWDDWLILISLVATIGTDILAVVALAIDPEGPGKASAFVPTEDYTAADRLYTKLSWSSTVLYFALTSTTKLSILFLYNRLFSINQLFRRFIITLSILVLIFWIGSTVANLLNCIPLKYTWINSEDDPRYCFNYNIFWFTDGIAEAFLDMLIILLPIKVIIGLHLNVKQKIAIASVFLLGVFVIVSGLLKAIFGYVPGSREPDFSRTQVWTTVHSGTGIICACLPVCWPLFVQLGQSRVRKWLSVSISWHHWHSLTSRHAASQTQHPETTSERAFHVTNSLTDRGFEVSYSGNNEEGSMYRKHVKLSRSNKSPESIV